MNKLEVSRENFEAWLKKENINIKAFDNIIAPYIDRYFENGKIDSSDITRKDIKIEHNISSCKKYFKISAGFEYATAFIQCKFGYDYDKSSSYEKKIARMFKIKILF